MYHIPQTRQTILVRWPKGLDLKGGKFSGDYDALANPFDLSQYIPPDEAERTYGLWTSLTGEPIRGASAEAPLPGTLRTVRTATRFTGQEVTLERPFSVGFSNNRPRETEKNTLQAILIAFKHDLPALIERRLYTPAGDILSIVRYHGAKVRQWSLSEADTGDDNSVVTVSVRFRVEFWSSEGGSR